MSEYAKAIIANAVTGDKDTTALISLLLPEWVENQHDNSILQTIITLTTTDKPVTPKTIAGIITSVVGVEETRSLFQSQSAVIDYIKQCNNPDGLSIKLCADQIKLDYIRREIRSAAKRVVDNLPVYQSAEEAASGAIEIMATGVDATIGDADAYTPEDAVKAYDDMRKAEASGLFHTWEFPFPSWQRYARFKQSEIVVFAAPSETGKSHFGLQMLAEACRRGDRVALFSGEMTPPELIDRLINHGLDRHDGDLDKSRIEVLSWDFIIYNGTITIDKILAACVRAKAMGRAFHLVIVDHVHLMDFDGKDGYRIALNRAMARFKGDVCNRLRAGVVLLCQLRKPENSSPNRRPRKSDIRESAAIENIADWIFLMARTNEDDVECTDARIWNDKRRGGRRLPTIDVHISDKHNRIVEGVGSESAVF